MRKLNNKGFTLVEIVIVIVIIAILAAMLVPALTQWINKSKIKTFTSACGTIKTAAAAVIADDYAVDGGMVAADGTVTFTDDALEAIGNDVNKEVVAEEIGNADFAIVSYDYDDDTIEITDGTFTGTSTNGGMWEVEKVSE